MAVSKLIPNGTLTNLRITILPGGHDDPSQGWTDGLTTIAKSGAIYLKVQFRVSEGKYSNNKFTSTIGLKSSKGPWWRKKGRELIIGILNSSSNIASQDKSSRAKRLRRLRSFKDMNGLEIIARVKTVKDQNGYMVNDIDEIIVPNKVENTSEMLKLRQTDLTAKLTAASVKPMWILD